LSFCRWAEKLRSKKDNNLTLICTDRSVTSIQREHENFTEIPSKSVVFTAILWHNGIQLLGTVRFWGPFKLPSSIKDKTTSKKLNCNETFPIVWLRIKVSIQLPETYRSIMDYRGQKLSENIYYLLTILFGVRQYDLLWRLSLCRFTIRRWKLVLTCFNHLFRESLGLSDT
jgi:hypothetical protein